MTGTVKAEPGLGHEVVGREVELAKLHAFLDADPGRAGLLLVGGPGIGKTTLWENGVEGARRRGVRVLVARPSDAEARLAFSSLIDLFDGVAAEELAGLPPPQLHALDVALLRAASARDAPETHAVGVGCLNAFRAVATSSPVLIALDDIQWLDASSASALTFVARRLEGTEIGFLLARRPGPASPLELALDPRGVERLELGPLSLGAIRRLLRERLALSMSRQLLRRIYDATLGNALFALEVGRKLVDEGPPGIGEVLPVPDAVEDLLGLRVDRLSEGVRRLLLAVALSPDLRVGQLEVLTDPETLDLAVSSGVLVVTGDHVRASHPLLAAAVVERADAVERRNLHRRLGAAVGDEELGARHRALAAARPDGGLAADVSAAAARANERGAPQTAVELAEHALRLTPRNDPDRAERILGLARYLELAGEKQRLTDLLVPAVASLPAGGQRVRACLLLASGTVSGNKDIRLFLERALAESTDAMSRAAVLAEMAANDAAVRVVRIADAEALALEALSLAGSGRWDVTRAALYALGWARSLGGRPIDDVCDRFQVPANVLYYFASSPERVAGQRLVWRGELTEARAFLLTLLAAADDRGEPSSYALLRLHLCELELRAGEWVAAERRLDEWTESSDSELLVWPMYERCRALLATGRGLPDEARRWAAEAMSRVAETGVCWDLLECRRALGTLELLAHDPGKAVEQLRPVWEHTEREGVRDPGAFPVAPELVEALADVGELEEARRVTTRLGELAAEQDHPWGRATADRCTAILRLSETYDEQAVTTLTRTAGELAGLGLAPDRARTLLSLGRAQRRFRKWGVARGTLEDAAAAFDELGSPGWADVARSELARVGARRPAPEGGLTAAERRVAELAASGLANKEIAQEMVVSVKTVEFHLSNTYAKLGIRSRGELAQTLGSQDPEDETLGS